MKSAYLVIAHGSKEPKSNQAFFDFLKEFQKKFPHRSVQPSFLELEKPSIPEGIQNCIRAGAKEIFVIPLMLFPGRHVKMDIPGYIEQAKAAHPEVDFHYAGPLADHPFMHDLLEAKAKTMRGKYA